MKKLIYLVAFLLTGALALPHAAHAQVKIGANPGTIGTSSGLEVEATNGKKVIVDKTDGTLTIQNVPASTTNTSILTIDANGVVNKQTQSAPALPIVFGTLTATGRTLTPSPPTISNFFGTGASITLPANSKYVVNFTHTLRSSTPAVASGTGLVRATLSDSNADGVVQSADITGPVIALGIINLAATTGILSGAFVITNTTASPKTYYMKGVLDVNSSTGAGSSYNLPAGYSIFGFGGPSEGGFYGIPVN
ncbi:MAG: hypothetical protein LH609_02590 [Rudanella sp.]|nr:hypothetical protein [Rudanella sp.]